MTPSQSFRHARLIAASTLLSSFLFALLFMPLVRLSQQFNAHQLHIPWKIYFPLYWILTFTFLAFALIGCVILIRKTWGKTPSKLRDAAYYSLLIAATVLLTPIWNNPFAHDSRIRQRYTTLRQLNEIRLVIDEYKTKHTGQWPSDLSVLLANGMPDQYLHYFNNRTPELTHSDASNAEIEASSDFVYFGGDLSDSPLLVQEASQILVFLGKTDLPEIPYVLDGIEGNYEYPYAARPAAFADGQVRCILPQDLNSTLAAHNAARARLGLPAQN